MESSDCAELTFKILKNLGGTSARNYQENAIGLIFFAEAYDVDGSLIFPGCESAGPITMVARYVIDIDGWDIERFDFVFTLNGSFDDFAVRKLRELLVSLPPTFIAGEKPR